MFESQNITSISGQTFFIPNEELNLLYLCCHGAYHRWFRLFWLKDFSYILQKHKFDPEKVLHQAKKLGLERLVSFSSKYAAGIFGVQNPFENLFAQKHNKYLIDRSIEALKTGAEMFETTKLKKASNIFYQLRLKKGLVYKIHCFKPLLPHYDDWKIIRLPNWLFFLYYPLRPVLWLYKKMGETEK